MSAPEGNQFWKLADPDKIGRPPKFETPKDLWDEVVCYFQSCDENPIVVQETCKTDKGVNTKTLSHQVPYTWEGLYCYLQVCNLNHYKEKEEFSSILTHIGNLIRNQKFTGAAVGIFNQNIIARDLGLVDKKEVKGEMSVDGLKIYKAEEK